ncbi:MAG: maleylpyruvate isomerase N-terminal domain-containing protein [Acidimicrobiales bacterium]
MVEPVIAALEEVWASIAEACRGIPAAAWDLPTDCPGWTVRDQLSHLVGIERALLGEQPPPAGGADHPHVKNEFAAVNETWVEARRGRPGNEVLEELRSVTARRSAALRAMTEEAFEEIGWSPVGQVPYRVFMEVRVFDCWVHEQDVRRALGRPGGLGGAGEVITLERMAGAMPFVVGRKVAPPDGTVVMWRVGGRDGRDGRAARQVVVVTEGGRGRALDAAPPEPTVVLSMGSTTFWRLACGRTTATAALAAGEVAVAGDAGLGGRVLEAMAVTP